MQNLSLDEIIALINDGITFEATHNDNFYIKIHEYVPYVCTAIHDGHRLREELVNNCLLSEGERLSEEDPHTGTFINSLPITLIGGDSRYEYDLNRDEDNCIYDIAWGKKVWKRPLTQEEKNQSLQKHRNFYKVVRTLLTKLESDFGAALVYDIHSYNYKRHNESYLFNIGVENVDTKRYNSHISNWKKELLTIRSRRFQPEVSVNHIFYGRGRLLKLAQAEFKNTLVLATEVKKVFMDEETGESFPLVIRDIAKGMKTAIISNSHHFVNSKANINVRKKSKLLNSDIQPELIQIDRRLFKQLKNFEILGFVNPINIEQEKKTFFKRKFSYNPQFRYRPLTVDPHNFKTQMYQSNLDQIEDVHIRQIYVDIIKSYSDKLDMLSSRGKDSFLYNSLGYFGKPTQKDIANANFLLYCNELPSFKEEEPLPLAEVKRMFEEEEQRYGFKFKLEIVSNITSDALVINSRKTVQLKKGAKFNPTSLKSLIHHEIGVHMVTTMNAREQPLHFLSLGLPKNTYTQEGLAIMSEMLSGNQTIDRLKELGLRVLAVESLAKGNDFKTTYEMLLASHYVAPEKLFYLVARVYRGGGFTKDYLYLRGFRKMLQMQENKVKMDNLFLGKTTHKYLAILNELVDRGILKKPKYLPYAFQHPETIDPILKYLTDSLK